MEKLGPDDHPQLEITLFGPVAAAALALLAERYDGVSSSRTCEADSVVTIDDIDPAGERAVLTLLWDTGHRVRAVVRRPS